MQKRLLSFLVSFHGASDIWISGDSDSALSEATNGRAEMDYTRDHLLPTRVSTDSVWSKTEWILLKRFGFCWLTEAVFKKKLNNALLADYCAIYIAKLPCMVSYRNVPHMPWGVQEVMFLCCDFASCVWGEIEWLKRIREIRNRAHVICKEIGALYKIWLFGVTERLGWGDWIIDWFIHWLIDWLIDWLIEWLTD